MLKIAILRQYLQFLFEISQLVPSLLLRFLKHKVYMEICAYLYIVFREKIKVGLTYKWRTETSESSGVGWGKVLSTETSQSKALRDENP